MSFLSQLARRQLLVVTGKGGVGKSTTAASLGRLLHRAGRRVLLLEIDPRESIHQLLSVPPSGGEIVEVEPRLYLEHLQPRAELDALVRDQLRIGPLVSRVLASPVYEHFAGGAPGLKELAVLGHALRLAQGKGGRRAPRVDVVVLDAPATGHGVSLLTAPSLAAEVIRHGPFGRMARDLSSLVADSDRCGVVVVTQAEEMPAQEALELEATLRSRIGRSPALLVVNGLYPPCPEAVADLHDETGLIALWRKRCEVNRRELQHLRSSWPEPIVELPLVPFGSGPELLEAMAYRLGPALDAVASGGAA